MTQFFKRLLFVAGALFALFPAQAQLTQVTDGSRTSTQCTSFTVANRTVTLTPAGCLGTASATVPGSPTIGTATPGNARITVAFTAPASNGGSPILDYTATCGAFAATGSASPLVVTGLANGTPYICSVTARNAVGSSAPSAASPSVTPSAPSVYAVSVSKSGAGSGTVSSNPAGIACGSTCAADFAAGSTVTLTASASAGSFFSGWGGACAGTSPCALTADAAKAVTANFSPNTTIPRLGNISTRMQVLSGSSVLIGGLTIGGSAPKTVVIRASGPSLAAAGITNPLANPVLQLFSGQVQMDMNDDWGTAPNATAILSSGFAPSNPQESAILVTLNPGAYTAIVTGSAGGTGVGLIEVFEVDRPDIPLTNLSSRGTVGTVNDVMIGGFIVQGATPQTVVVRARGPSLASAGLAGVLANPSLQLFSGSTLMASNDDWGSAANAALILSSGFAPSDPSESVILMTLSPGAYTAVVSGVGGTTGVAIVEIFALP